MKSCEKMMEHKSTKWFLGGVLAVALVGSLTLWLRPTGETVPKPAEPLFTVPATEPSGTEGSRARAPLATLLASRRPPVNDVSEVPDLTDYGPPVRVPADEELANVNGVGITLSDLMPVAADSSKSEQVMTTARYEFLLERAVERELILQTARAQGVELNERQRQALAEAAERRRAATQREEVFDDLQDAPENAEFQQRDFAALMLQANLAEKAGVPSPHIGPEHVTAYYHQHQGEYGALPSDPSLRVAAWEKIERDIRATLAPLARQLHQDQMTSYVQGLKDGAEILAAQRDD